MNSINSYATSSEKSKNDLYPIYSWCPAVTQDGGMSISSITPSGSSAGCVYGEWGTDGVSFSGQLGQGILCSSDTITGDTQTVAVYFKIDDTGNQNYTIINGCSYEEPEPRIELRYDKSNKFYFNRRVSTWTDVVTSSGFTPQSDTWYVAILRSSPSDTFDLWINGEQVGEDNPASTFEDVDTILMGKYYTDTNRLKGTIAGFYYWDKLLSEEEIGKVSNDFWYPIRKKTLLGESEIL